MDRAAWKATVHGGRERVRHDLVTKQQQKSSMYIWVKEAGGLALVLLSAVQDQSSGHQLGTSA